MLLGGIVLLLLGSVSLVGFKLVVLKMLPFDNKSEFQVVVDMPEGTSVEPMDGAAQRAFGRRRSGPLALRSFSGPQSREIPSEL